MSRRSRIPRWNMRQWRAAYDAEHGARQHAAVAHARAVAELRDNECRAEVRDPAPDEPALEAETRG